jgi:hypothetical protein
MATTGDDNGRLPGEDEVDDAKEADGAGAAKAAVVSRLLEWQRAEDEKKAGLMEEAAGFVDGLQPKLPREKALAVVATALELDEEPGPWLGLAERTGATMPLRLLYGGRAGVDGFADAKRAVDARAARAEATREWISSADGLGLPTDAMSKRRALLVVKDKDGEEGKDVPWLPGGIVGLVVASGGTGKTTWLAELAMRVAFGDPRNAAHGVPYRVADEASGPVMVLLAEEDEQGVRAALRRGLNKALVGGDPEPTDDAWRSQVWALGGADHTTALGSLVMVDDPVRGRVTEVVPSALHDVLCEKARKMGPMLVVLDPINQLLPAGASENDATAAAGMIALAGDLRRAAEEGVRTRWKERTGWPEKDYCGPRPVVLLAHHERKAKQEGQKSGADVARGSTAFVDNARWVCRLESVPKAGGAVSVTRWELVKTNYTRRCEHEAVATWDASGLAWREITEADQKAWAVSTGEIDQKKTREALLEALGAAGDRGMTRSQAESAHGAAVVHPAEDEGLVVAVMKGGGQRLYLAKHAPEGAVVADSSFKPFEAGDDDPSGGMF